MDKLWVQQRILDLIRSLLDLQSIWDCCCLYLPSILLPFMFVRFRKCLAALDILIPVKLYNQAHPVHVPIIPVTPSQNKTSQALITWGWSNCWELGLHSKPGRRRQLHAWVTPRNYSKVYVMHWLITEYDTPNRRLLLRLANTLFTFFHWLSLSRQFKQRHVCQMCINVKQ